MPEAYKLKYLEICENEDIVYEFVNNWNILSNKNAFMSKEEKIKQLEYIRKKDFKLYQVMKEDINAELY